MTDVVNAVARPSWIIMPILAHPEYTRAAIADCLAQTVDARLLLVNQGVDDAFRDELERIAEAHDDRVLLWNHQPPLPSLAGTWNEALRFVWASGGQEALVVNNDVRLHRSTYEHLSTALWRDGLFVSAVGVTPEQFDPAAVYSDVTRDGPLYGSHGGPDFSCFLISRDCHERFQFDEGFVPAFCEDLDYHRRLILAGNGALIFSVNLPYLHYGSTTLKTVKDRGPIDRAIAQGARAYYRRKWGGDCNQETFVLPFRQREDRDVSTPTLQRLIQEGHPEQLPRVDPVWLGGQGNYDPGEEASRGENPRPAAAL